MSINPLSLLKSKPASKNVVKLMAVDSHPIDRKILDSLKECEPDIEKLANKKDVSEIKLAQNGNLLLANCGIITKYTKISNIDNAKKLYGFVEESIAASKNPHRELEKFEDIKG